MAKALEPRKTPSQARSRATREVILEAAARILEGQTASPFTTNHIAEIAGVSIGTLYQYYPGKQAILAGLILNMREVMLDDFRAALAGVDPGDLRACVEAGIRASLCHHLERPALAEALEAAERRLPLDKDLLAIKQKMHALIVALLARHQIAHPERMAFDIIAIAHGMAEAAVQRGETDFESLFHRINRAVIGYLSSGD
ncbi:MAG: TetR/AcrR family transcriptional regulator [Proteobacteria bacterium]|nr:TetR/AcrR family transcriptional regulator [Pseudomonadota bacterium]